MEDRARRPPIPSNSHEPLLLVLLASFGFSFWIFAGPALGQTVFPSWSFAGAQPGAHLGASVSSAGDVDADGFDDVLVGAPHGGPDGEGLVFLFRGSPDGLSATPAWTAAGAHPGAEFGFGVASAGDVNGDGYGDVVIGEPGRDGQRGAASVHLGSAGGLAATPSRVWMGAAPGGRFGAAVAGAGDVDVDGYADLLVGAPGFDGGESDEGAAFLFRGASPPPALPAWSAEGNQAGAAFGTSLAGLGDMTGDGFGEVAVGAPLFDNGYVDQGQVRVFAGHASGLDPSPLGAFEIRKPGARFGFAVAGGGDLTGDGVRRILFGAPIYDYTHVEEGGTFLGTLGTLPFFLDFGRQAFAHRGVAIASAGDVNADGLLDVVIGADDYDQGEPDEGLVTVHFGHFSFVVDRTAAWVVDVDQAYAAFGSAVASAGDVNGDGYGDVVAGAPLYDLGAADVGRAFVYLGPAGATVGVGDGTNASPAAMTLRIRGSHPFRASLDLGYTIPRAGAVRLTVHEVAGRRVAVIVDDEKPSGAHAATWSGRDDDGVECPPGVYFARLVFAGDVVTRKLVRTF
jgi:hypothetical protein